jgi:hypothetical protein
VHAGFLRTWKEQNISQFYSLYRLVSGKTAEPQESGATEQSKSNYLKILETLD